MYSKTMVGLVALSVGACASQPKNTAPEPDPVVKVERLFPQPESLDASTLLVKVSIGNPRTSAVTLRDITYQVDTGEVAGVIEGTVEVGSAIEGEQLAEAEFSVEIPFPKTDPETYKAVLTAGLVELTVKGTANFEDAGSVGFERRGRVATPSLPKFIVHDAQAARYGKEGLDVTFFLRLINENAFTVTVGEVNYKVEVFEKVLKEQSAGIGSTLVAGAAQEFEVSAVLEEKTFPGITEKLKSGKLEYRVFGVISVDEIEDTFDAPGEISVEMD